MVEPLAIELFAGTMSGTAGWCELGGSAIGFDLEYLPHHGKPHERGYRVIQDVLTLHGSQFKDATFIWASPPCQKYSYLAMPWSRSKCPLCKGRKEYYAWQLTPERPPSSADVKTWGEPIPCDCKENSRKAKELRADWEKNGPDNRLFDACFRIQREAVEATGKPCPACDGIGPRHSDRICPRCDGTAWVTRYIPMIVENVRGAVPWVGPAAAQFGSFFLWGDVGQIGKRVVAGRELADIRAGRGRFGMGVAPEKLIQTASVEASGVKVPGQIQGKEYAMCRTGAEHDAVRDGATKIGGDWFSDPNSTCRKHGSRSNARKAASALIAKIPPALSAYIAAQHWPDGVQSATVEPNSMRFA